MKREKQKPKWSDEDRRAFTDQKLRAKTIESKRFDGPKSEEWDDLEVIISRHA